MFIGGSILGKIPLEDKKKSLLVKEEPFSEHETAGLG
jgi:hypothetical protein